MHCCRICDTTLHCSNFRLPQECVKIEKDWEVIMGSKTIKCHYQYFNITPFDAEALESICPVSKSVHTQTHFYHLLICAALEILTFHYDKINIMVFCYFVHIYSRNKNGNNHPLTFSCVLMFKRCVFIGTINAIQFNANLQGLLVQKSCLVHHIDVNVCSSLHNIRQDFEHARGLHTAVHVQPLVFSDGEMLRALSAECKN